MQKYEYEYDSMMRPQCRNCKMHKMMLPQNMMPAQNMMPSNVMSENYNMPQHYMNEDLEEMYPQIYHTIHYHVKHHCHMMEMASGHMPHYRKEDIDDMCERIYDDCEKEIYEYMNEEDHEDSFMDEHDHKDDHEHEHDHDHHHRQYGHHRNRFGMDLVRILLLNELFRRRRRRPYPYYHHGY